MPADVVDRPLLPPDLEALLRIEGQAGGWTRNQLYWFVHRPHVTFHVLAAKASPDVPVGFFALADRSDHLYVANLVVEAAFRRRGVGSYALRRIDEIARLRGRARIVLDVQERNLPAQLLYRKHGFLAREILRGYYGDQDGYRMTKELERVAATAG